MDLYTLTMNGEMVDLDDPKIYPLKWRKMSAEQLYHLAADRLGASFFYMDFLNPDPRKNWEPQRSQVVGYCWVLAHLRRSCWRNNPQMQDEYTKELLKFTYKIHDLLENQC